MATNECAYAIEQFKIRLDELGEKVENNAKNDTEENVEITQVWQKALAVWRKTMESLFNSTSVTDTALYEDCSYVFFDKIYTRLHFGKRLQKDGSLCYEVFYSCLDLLNVLVVDQHYLSNDNVCTLQNNSMGKYFYIVLCLCRMATNYVLFKDELVHDYMTFLKILKAYADKKVMDELSSSQKTFYTITAEILIFFWCMANRTILVPSLVLIDLPSSAVRWLANCSCLNADATEPLIRIIYNVARHDDGADEYNKLNAMEVVKEYQRR